jgi:hypothetical protein
MIDRLRLQQDIVLRFERPGTPRFLARRNTLRRPVLPFMDCEPVCGRTRKSALLAPFSNSRKASLLAAASVALLLSLQLFCLAVPPNIIVFLVDDYDKAEASVYGGNVLTPNLDRLAREGMVFHNFHVSSTVCTPSRYGFLTGRYAGSSDSAEYLAECPLGKQGGSDVIAKLAEMNSKDRKERKK